ncbi:hypothetical protein PV326_000839, partial [Microctonus aethiopoides]
MAATTPDEGDTDISGILKLIEESNKEGQALSTTSLAFINERRNMANYTIPRLNPRYGNKRGDWMIEEPSVTKPPVRRPVPPTRAPQKPRVTKSEIVLPPAKIKPVRKKIIRRPESTPEAKAQAIPPEKFKNRAKPVTTPAEPKGPRPSAVSGPPPQSREPGKTPSTSVATKGPPANTPATSHASVVVSTSLQGVLRQIAAREAATRTSADERTPIQLRIVPSRPPMPKPTPAL